MFTPVLGDLIFVELIKKNETEERIKTWEETVDTLTLNIERIIIFDTIKRIYGNTGNTEVVEKALAKGWITAEEKEIILAA